MTTLALALVRSGRFADAQGLLADNLAHRSFAELPFDLLVIALADIGVGESRRAVVHTTLAHRIRAFVTQTSVEWQTDFEVLAAEADAALDPSAASGAGR